MYNNRVGVNVNLNFLPFFLVVSTVSMMFAERSMTSEALPLMKPQQHQARHERKFSVDEPLHGSDLLSIFLETPDPPLSTTETNTESPSSMTTDRRVIRSTLFDDDRHQQFIRKIKPTVGNLFEINRSNRITSDKSSEEGVVLAVRVSASVAKKVEDKPPNNNEIDQVASEDRPLGSVLIAENTKHEFGVEEKEPILTSYDRRLNPSPYPDTVIYHDGEYNDEEPKSISYSSIVHSHERQERHYDDNKNVNVNKLTSSPTNGDRRIYPPSSVQGLPKIHSFPEQNYEVDESDSLVSNGRVHGVQKNRKKQPETSSAPPDDDHQKVGYVVEGRNYRKYRVEERTSDGFIVGEYGVVSHDDGSLRGVRYTADGTINPRLIYDALMKFLSL